MSVIHSACVGLHLLVRLLGYVLGVGELGWQRCREVGVGVLESGRVWSGQIEARVAHSLRLSDIVEVVPLMVIEIVVICQSDRHLLHSRHLDLIRLILLLLLLLLCQKGRD